jgi:DNA polymerase-3 subunit delta
LPPREAPASCQAFLLTGEDDLARRERLEELVAERLDETSRAFNLDRLSARDADPEKLATLLQTPPLLGEARVVVLDEADGASAAIERAIEEFLAAPSSTTCLIALANGRLNGAPWTLFREVGREETFEPPRGAGELGGRIRRRAEKAGKEIAPDAARLLADLLADDASALAGEMAKLVAHVGERRRIETADVEAVAVSTPAGNKYTFVDLVGMGRRDEALLELHALLESGESPLYLVTLLTQHFLFLGGIRACEARGIRSPDAIGRALGKSAWLLTKKNAEISGYRSPREQARRYDRAAIDRWLSGLLELDLALKSSRLPPAALLEGVVLRLMSTASAAGRGVLENDRKGGTE